MILVTGSSGLVGAHVCAVLERNHIPVRRFDLRNNPNEDVCDSDKIRAACEAVTGIIHLAAVSRVIHGERDPARCQRVNVDGLNTVLNAALDCQVRPWFIFASSREVYGNAAVSPTPEDSPYAALNVYARTKVAGEGLVFKAREAGLVANVCRLSTVYGSVDDHADRVLPAFCRAAAAGDDIRIDGDDVVLDPTHIDDVSGGLASLADMTENEGLLPVIHFVSGQGCSLAKLADLAIAAGHSSPSVVMSAPRSFDVKHFVGDARRAKSILGWSVRTSIEEGVANFVERFHAAKQPEILVS